MLSLRNLLAPRRPMRSFALVDNQGICRALRQSAHAPQGFGWIEVQQSSLSWLNSPLPASAQVAQATPCMRLPRTLAA
ncbi:MAG: hypothetical protein VCA57_15530 [Pseudomonas sp.]|uniref:hypothetical protein n=1 Tax=Pseudomonas sp. TaxID=306 RepID=UPI003981A2E6